MSTPGDSPEARRVLAEGRFLRLVAARGWEWAERVGATGGAVIAAVTEDGQLVLVEQYRIPLEAPVIDLPAGLVGDEPAKPREDTAEAARRELLEETGYEASRLEYLTDGPSSPGLTTECYTLFLARDVHRIGRGGGDAGEDILVHVVPLAEVEAWLDAQRRGGTVIDPKIYVALYFIGQRGLIPPPSAARRG